MALDPVPWMVGGGATHSADVARVLPWLSSGGRTGIVQGSDFKAHQYSGAAGTGIEFDAGTAILENKYTGARSQAYVVTGQTATQVAVAATAGVAETKYLIVRIYDPQYPGQPAPPSVPNGPYNFAEIVTSVTGLTYPFIALARIEQPANTTVILDSMIFDLRKMAVIKNDRKLLAIYQTGNKTVSGHPVPTSAYGSWPIKSTQKPSIFVPEWANKLLVVAQFSGVYFSGSAADTVAGIRVQLGAATAGENGIIMEDNTGRYHYTCIGTQSVLSSMRGTNQLLDLQGFRSSGVGQWYSDYQTSISIDYQFTEDPV